MIYFKVSYIQFSATGKAQNCMLLNNDAIDTFRKWQGSLSEEQQVSAAKCYTIHKSATCSYYSEVSSIQKEVSIIFSNLPWNIRVLFSL